MSKTDQHRIFHIAQQTDLLEARQSGRYVCDSLSSEGFIHCCLDTQLQGVIDRYYQDVTGQVLLCLDPALLQSECRYENTVGGTEEFPHTYGPINLDAIVSEGTLSRNVNRVNLKLSQIHTLVRKDAVCAVSS